MVDCIKFMHTYTYIQTYIHTYINTYIPTNIQNIYTNIYTYIHRFIYMHTYIHTGQTESNSSPEEDFSSPDAYDDVGKRHCAPRHRTRNLSVQNNYPHNERGSQSYRSSSYNTSQNTNAMSESNSHNNGSESQHIPLDNQLFKIFRTANNEEYTVYEREDGHMFYVDWEQQVIYT